MSLKIKEATLLATLMLSAALPVTAVAQVATNPTSFTPPQIFFPPQVPTDVTGPGGSLGRAQGLREKILGPDRNTLPNSHGIIVARDPRYSFSGRWTPFSSAATGVAMLVPANVTSSAVSLQTRTLAAVVASPTPVIIGNALDAKIGGIGAIDRSANMRNDIPYIMPTCGAAISQLCPDQLQLSNGAVLVKASAGPVKVAVPVGSETAVVRLQSNAMAMISAMDGRLLVSNLTDDARDSVMVYLSDKTRGDYGYSPVRIGYAVEVYPNGICRANNELVSYTVLNRIPMTDGLTLETMRFSYPRTLKRYNLAQALPACDLRRVVKTAAAVSYMDREREWNDLTPYAP